mgnify:CR=1 FL=1
MGIGRSLYQGPKETGRLSVAKVKTEVIQKLFPHSGVVWENITQCRVIVYILASLKAAIQRAGIARMVRSKCPRYSLLREERLLH